mmetsp:Transcript_17455/g.40126  ORF Transcript_17455/g.40126 Transcript_17455/m.40126 type:complete len:1268 (-) Transcript_17455:147-3950(-)
MNRGRREKKVQSTPAPSRPRDGSPRPWTNQSSGRETKNETQVRDPRWPSRRRSETLAKATGKSGGPGGPEPQPPKASRLHVAGSQPGKADSGAPSGSQQTGRAQLGSPGGMPTSAPAPPARPFVSGSRGSRGRSAAQARIKTAVGLWRRAPGSLEAPEAPMPASESKRQAAPELGRVSAPKPLRGVAGEAASKPGPKLSAQPSAERGRAAESNQAAPPAVGGQWAGPSKAGGGVAVCEDGEAPEWDVVGRMSFGRRSPVYSRTPSPEPPEPEADRALGRSTATANSEPSDTAGPSKKNSMGTATTSTAELIARFEGGAAAQPLALPLAQPLAQPLAESGFVSLGRESFCGADGPPDWAAEDLEGLQASEPPSVSPAPGNTEDHNRLAPPRSSSAGSSAAAKPEAHVSPPPPPVLERPPVHGLSGSSQNGGSPPLPPPLPPPPRQYQLPGPPLDRLDGAPPREACFGPPFPRNAAPHPPHAPVAAQVALPHMAQPARAPPGPHPAMLRSRAFRPTRAVTVKEALRAAEVGNSGVLAAYLHAGGDPHAKVQAKIQAKVQAKVQGGGSKAGSKLQVNNQGSPQLKALSGAAEPSTTSPGSGGGGDTPPRFQRVRSEPTPESPSRKSPLANPDSLAGLGSPPPFSFDSCKPWGPSKEKPSPPSRGWSLLHLAAGCALFEQAFQEFDPKLSPPLGPGPPTDTASSQQKPTPPVRLAAEEPPPGSPRGSPGEPTAARRASPNGSPNGSPAPSPMGPLDLPAHKWPTRPEAESPDGYATCVSLLIAAGADPNAARLAPDRSLFAARSDAPPPRRGASGAPHVVQHAGSAGPPFQDRPRLGSSSSPGGGHRAGDSPNRGESVAKRATPRLAFGAFDWGGVTALAGACLCQDTECCRLLLQVGASAADMGGPAGLELPEPLKGTEPRLLPRSPLQVTARLLDHFEGHGEFLEPTGARDVEVHWVVAPAAAPASAPTSVSAPGTASAACAGLRGASEVQRYVVRAYSAGKEVEVVHTAAGPTNRRKQRRDFCKNQVVDRGIALRMNLGLSQPRTTSTLIHGLSPGVTYHFTVSCIAEVQGALRESPPSLMSKPLDIPTADEDEWNMGEILDKVFAYGLERPSAYPHLPPDSGCPHPVAPCPRQGPTPPGMLAAAAQDAQSAAASEAWSALPFEALEAGGPGGGGGGGPLNSPGAVEAVATRWGEVPPLAQGATRAASFDHALPHAMAHEAAFRAEEPPPEEHARVGQILREVREKGLLRDKAPGISGENGGEDCVLS